MAERYYTTVIDFGSGFVRAILADDDLTNFAPITYRNIYGVPKYGSIIESFSNYLTNNLISSESKDDMTDVLNSTSTSTISGKALFSLSYPGQSINKIQQKYDERYVGPAASENRSILKLYSVFDNNGRCTEAEAMQSSLICALRLVYEKSKKAGGECAKLKTFEDFMRSTRVIITISSFQFRYNDFSSGFLNGLKRFLLNDLKVRSTLFIPSGILTFYTSIAESMNPGIVLTIGETETSAIPVFGVCNSVAVGRPSDMRCSHIGGRNITRSFASLLSEYGTLSLQTPLNILESGINSEMEMIREVKEKLCAVIPSATPSKWLRELDTKRKSSQDPINAGIHVIDNELTELKSNGLEIWNYELPDGTEIEIGTKYEHLLAPEVLFRPQEVGIDEPSVVDLLKEIFFAVDRDMSKKLLKNIIIAGGCANMRGIVERIKEELYEELSTLIRIEKKDINIIKYSNSDNSACLGGCAIAKINAFNGLFYSDSENQNSK